MFPSRGKILGVAFLLLLAAVGIFISSLRHEPRFYEAAISVDPPAQRAASDELLTTAAALASTVRHSGPWSVELTDEQLNGWLAVDLPENHGQLIPKPFSEPRIRLKPGEITLACRYEAGGVQPILSLELRAHLAAPNVVAIQVVRARAGAIPVPLDQVLEGIARLAAAWNARLEWKQQAGDPVALITLPPIRTTDGIVTRLDHFEIRDGSIVLAGLSQAGTNLSARPAQDGEKVANQR